MYGGMPDLRQLPYDAMARAYRRAMRAGSRSMDYAHPAGEPALRGALAEMLSHTRGMAASAEDIVVTRGSQQALYLAARALLRPGDVVAVEAVGYRPAWEAFRAAGARLVAVDVDREGFRVDALRRVIASRLRDGERLRAVYLTPHHQYPTTALLSAPRRLELIQLCRELRLAIFEDDYDHEFHYDGHPVRPLAARAPEHVIYVGTLSKVFAPALRLGWVVAPPPVREAILAARTYVDRQGDRVQERAFADLFEEGEVLRHSLRMKRVYRERRGHLVTRLREAFGDNLEFDVPRGGMALWVKATGVDTDAWAARAAERGVLFQPGAQFGLEREVRHHARIGYGALTTDELDRAVRKLAAAFE